MTIYNSDIYEIKRAINKTVNFLYKYTKKVDRNLIKKCLLSDEIFERKIIDKELSTYEQVKNKFIKNKIKKAKLMAKNIAKNTDILFVGITGSVAMGMPERNDDIDILVITKKNKLWKTRFSIRWYLFINKIPHRKYNKKENIDEFCFNLWIDNSKLKIPAIKQNLRNAIDLVNIVPLIDKKNTYNLFVESNKYWLRKYVANQLTNIECKNQTKYIENSNCFSYVSNLFWYCPQKIYLSLKNKGNLVTKNQAFFHN